MAVGYSDPRTDTLSELAELLIEAKGLADVEDDPVLQMNVRDALFRIAQLLAERISEHVPDKQH